MEFMVLKMLPDQVRIMADAIERDLIEEATVRHVEERRHILTWLRYRLTKWDARHPTAPAA